MISLKRGVFSFSVLFLLFFASAAWADLTLTNGDFSSVSITAPLNLSVGGQGGSTWNAGPIPGWTGVGIYGQQTPGTGAEALYSSLPESKPYFVYSNGGTISQDMGSVVAGEIYILDVWVGARTDYYAGDAGTYSSGKISSIDVVVGGNTFYAVGTPPTPGSGLFSMWTVTFSGAAGQDATVNLGPALSGSQADYADLFLDPSFTPEPGFYGALALGLGGLIGAGRLRRAKQ